MCEKFIRLLYKGDRGREIKDSQKSIHHKDITEGLGSL